LLNILRATFLEVDSGEDPGLHKDDLLTFSLGRDHFVAHFAINITLSPRQLHSLTTTISISRVRSNYFYLSWLDVFGVLPAVMRPRTRLPIPSELVFSCLLTQRVLGDFRVNGGLDVAGHSIILILLPSSSISEQY
jgi:hypothetical protein